MRVLSEAFRDAISPCRVGDPVGGAPAARARPPVSPHTPTSGDNAVCPVRENAEPSLPGPYTAPGWRPGRSSAPRLRGPRQSRRSITRLTRRPWRPGPGRPRPGTATGSARSATRSSHAGSRWPGRRAGTGRTVPTGQQDLGDRPAVPAVVPGRAVLPQAPPVRLGHHVQPVQQRPPQRHPRHRRQVVFRRRHDRRRRTTGRTRQHDILDLEQQPGIVHLASALPQRL